MWLEFLARRDAHAKIVQESVLQPVNPAVHGHGLTSIPRVAYNRGLAHVAHLFEHVELTKDIRANMVGACTVHQDGEAIRSCVTPISAARGKKIITIEAATDGSDRVGAAVHAAWVKHDVAQCGYCQSGQIMSATAVLKALPRGQQPSADEIDQAMAGNICRCGTYARIRAAVADAARSLA